MQYRKKPVIIDALQWNGENHRSMWEFLGGSPDEYIKTSGKHFIIDHQAVKGGLIIRTLEGDMKANIGDYIIKGVNGEYYPCKPDIFKKTYDMVESE